MKFDELNIQRDYNSFKNNIYTDFFNLVLPHCYTYKRFGGTFSGKKFVEFAYGLKEFIHRNEGTMQLIIIPAFEESDVLAFKEDTIKKAFVEKWIEDLSKIDDEFSKNHVKALAGLIVSHRLQIKLILPKKDDKNYFTKKELEEENVNFDEIGIFENIDDRELISIRGQVSTELSKKTWFSVSRYWESDENKTLDRDWELFYKVWETSFGEDVEINGIKFEVNQLSDEIIDFFNQESTGIDLQKIELDTPPSQPRPYQERAISGWIENGKRGMLEMATGTGKTFTAVECLRRIQNDENLFVVITAPYDHLVEQWYDELENFNIKPTILKNNWRTTLGNKLDIAHDEKLTVVLCTHAKFNSDDFKNKINMYKKIKKFVIIDEVHHLGAGLTVDNSDYEDKFEFENSLNGLIENYDYRLGLSATIDRYFDDDGTEFLDKYFMGKTSSRVIKFDMNDAIQGGFLCNYDYHPFVVNLTEQELQDYKKITRDAVIKMNSANEKDKSFGKYLIMIKRANKIKDAENKIDAFKKILKEIKNPRYLLIFASQTQIPIIKKILVDAENQIGIENPTFEVITHEDPPNTKDRLPILRRFQRGDTQIIIANRVLDEGLNIPEAKSCIILASTGNPTQFIQRRGRVLRTFFGAYKDGTVKTSAVIYDVLVKPEIGEWDDPDEIKMEINLIKNQLEKIGYMSDLARNRKRTNEINEFLKIFKSNIPEEMFHS